MYGGIETLRVRSSQRYALVKGQAETRGNRDRHCLGTESGNEGKKKVIEK